MRYEAHILFQPPLRGIASTIRAIEASNDAQAKSEFARLKAKYPAEAFEKGSIRAKLLQTNGSGLPIIIAL